MVVHAVLASVVRSGVVESQHLGSAIVLAPDGRCLLRVGDPADVVLPRSALKPLQAVAMLRAGLAIDGPLLALAAASHSGERFHLDGVRRMLETAGLPLDALQNTPDLPLDEDERLAWRLAGRTPSALAQNCSGKHAAMLLTCHENGWPRPDYRSPDHPLQLQIAQTVAELTGEPVGAAATDGCGAPALGVSLAGLARAFGWLATAPEGSPEGRVAVAMRRHPEWVGGTGRGVTRLMTAVPGLVAKDGAEAVFAAALPDGAAIALKIGDGGQRPVLPVVVALLHRLGVGEPALEALAEVPVLGHGKPVGRIDVAAW